MKILCLTWAPSSRRMDEIATELKANLKTKVERWDCNILFKVKCLAPFRYVLMMMLTLIKLSRTKPDIIIAQNPPIFLPITCWVYSLLAKNLLIIDHHCIWSEKAFQNLILKKIIANFEKFLITKVKLNLSPHDVWSKKLQILGGITKTNVQTLIDYVEEVSIKKVNKEKFCKTKYLIVYPGGTGAKERPEIAIEAIKKLNNITLVITGKKEYLKKVLDYESSKIIFSGFLPDEEYFGLMKEANCILNITDEPNTIPHFLYEVVAVSRPIISSLNKPIFQVFDNSIYMIQKNTPEQLTKAITYLLANEKEWTQKVRIIHSKLRERRQREIKKLITHIQT